MSFKVEGMDDLLKEVGKLEDRAQKRIILKGLTAIGKLLVKEAKQRAPVGELDDGFHAKGNLRRSIAIKKLTRLGIDDVAVLVGPRVKGGRNASGSHGNLIEKGTKAHSIAKKRSKKSYKHKGSRKQAFLKASYKAMESQANIEMIKILEKVLYG